MIASQTGRRLLLALILLGAVLAFVTQFLLGRDGTVSEPVSQKVIDQFLKHFIPLFGIVGAFYFSEKGDTEAGNTSRSAVEGFIFALVCVGIWVLLPTISLLISQTFESALRLLERFEAFGTTIAVTGLTYFFSTSAPPRRIT